jgi:hypothetical protein
LLLFLSDVSFNTNSLPHLVFGSKTRSPNETATATTTAATERQSMEQLGCELRFLADSFSSKVREVQLYFIYIIFSCHA